MRLVVQRVSYASVLVDRKVVGEIDKGLFVLLGVGKSDSKKDADLLTDKLAKLRIMSDKKGKMNLSVKDVDGSFLVVSQFTLSADTSKGNRPSFIKAADPKSAEELYEYFIDSLKKKNLKVESGKFGAYMDIRTKLDGPVTIILDSGEL